MRNSILISIAIILFNFSVSAQLDYLYNDSIPHSALLLSQYIQYPSVTGNERDAGLFLASIAMQKGLYVTLLTDHTDTLNFVASLYPLELKKPNIILLNHIDVVPASNIDEFTYEPFSGTIADGQIWGRGAIDNKGMAVMQLLGMERFVELAKKKDLPYNVTFLSVSGEETGGYTGAKIVSERFIELLNPFVFYGEGGTGIPGLLKNDPERKVFTISTTFKRRLFLNLTLNMNTTGHGSVPPRSYAPQEMINSMNSLISRKSKIEFSKTTRLMFYELGRLEGGLRGLGLRNTRLFRPVVNKSIRKDEMIHSLFVNTVTITGINTPYGNVNQIPQSISVILDCRLLPDVQTDVFIADLLKILSNDDLDVNIIHEDIHAAPTQLGQYYTLMERALDKVYPDCGVVPVLMPASNDNNYFRAVGVPSYGILPVLMQMEHILSIHNIDERIPIKALEEGVEVYYELLKEFFEPYYSN
jgi:carboxypeptidase PM20D1